MDLITEILDHIDIGLVVTNPQAIIISFNKKALELSQQFFYEPLQSGKQLEHLLSPQRKELVLEHYRNIREKKKTERFFETFPIGNSSAHLEFSCTPLKEDSGRVAQIIIFIRDITQQKVFEKKLVNIIENTGHLIETANAMVIGLDTRGYITDWNAHCTAITGYEKNAVYAQKLADLLLVTTEEKILFQAALDRVLAREETSQSNLPIKDKQGNIIEILTSFSPRYSSSGEIVGVILVAQDITELVAYRKSLEEQVQLGTQQLKAMLKREKEVVEQKSRFISMASHEFRTPLISLKHNIQKLKDELSNRFEQVAKIGSMEKQVDHMLYLLDEFLTYTKQEPGKIKVSIAPLRINEFLEKVCEEVWRSTGCTHKIQITYENLIEIYHSDEKLLRSIITNLLTNAIKFSPGKEKITVFVRHSEEYFSMTITDEGIGMTKEEVEKVFEPFIRGDQVAHIPGTGLGLSIVKRAVALLQGKIDIQSEPGRGTSVLIRLPEIHELQIENKSIVSG